MSLSGTIVDHCLNTAYEDIPKSALEVQKKSLIDAIGVMEAATTQGAGCRAFLEYAAESGDKPVCTVIGTGKKASPEHAALANGSLGHALDFEDSSARATLHPNAVPTPVMLALAEYKGGITGKELLAALTIASDMCCRLSLACNKDLSQFGWYSPPIFGSMSAVLAGSRLLDFSKEQTLDALACNLFQATGSSELINNKETVMRSVRDGFGAQAAVSSLLIANKGVTTRFEEPFEGNKGFYAAYTRGDCDLSRITKDLGREYIGEELTFKYWPACHGTHTGIYTIMKIMKEHDLSFEDINSVHVSISEFSSQILMEPREVKNRPVTAINGKFSIPYTLGLAAKRGRVTLEDFTPEMIRDEEIYDFAERVTYEINPELKEKYQTNYIYMTVDSKKGVFKEYCEYAIGDPRCPMSEEQFRGKFMNCVQLSSGGFTEKRASTLYDRLMNIEEETDVREIIGML